MSTIKTDRLSSTHIPLPQVDGITEVELFVATAGQVNFDLTAIDSSMQIRVFVGMDEATWSWVDSNTITVTAPAITAGAKVRVYKVFGDIAYKPLTFFDAYALKTDNVASSSKLQVARTINGVPFDGTANIAIEDSSKLPLAGGTMTGVLSFSAPDMHITHVDTVANITRHIHSNNGDMGFLTSAGGWAARSDDAGNWIATGNVTAYSDIRLKTDIQVIPDALGKVLALRGVTYARKDTGVRQTGVIAQEIAAVLPEAVDESGEYLAVAYGNLVGLLIEAIKELNSKVDSLQKELDELRRAT